MSADVCEYLLYQLDGDLDNDLDSQAVTSLIHGDSNIHLEIHSHTKEAFVVATLNQTPSEDGLDYCVDCPGAFNCYAQGAFYRPRKSVDEPKLLSDNPSELQILEERLG